MKNVGRKQKYGEPTVPMRIPESMVPIIEELLSKREVFNTQFEESLLPPVAEKLINRIHLIMEENYNDSIESIVGFFECLVNQIQSESGKEELLNKIQVMKQQHRVLIEGYNKRNPTMLRAYLSASIAPDGGSSVIGLHADLLEKKI